MTLMLQGAAFAADSATPAPMHAKAIFERDVEAGTSSLMAAKFTLQLLDGNQGRLVSFDHIFTTGDAFNLLVTPSRDVYLFVVNINPQGEVRLVWPSEMKFVRDANKISRGMEKRIPMVFVGTEGDEWLLLVLSPVNIMPNLDRLKLEIPIYRRAPCRVVEYDEIFTKPTDIAPKGIFGLTDGSTPDNPVTYCAQTGEGEKVLVYPYLLRHQQEQDAPPDQAQPRQ